MFLNTKDFGFLEAIIAKAPAIQRELFDALAEDRKSSGKMLSDGSMDYPSNQWTWDNEINTAAIGYDLRDGDYAMLTLYKPGHTIEGVQDTFEQTLTLLSQVPGLAYACISSLAPHAHLALHKHSRRHYIFHLLLNDLEDEGCEIICDGHTRHLKQAGDSVLFDYTLPHETFSRSHSTRFNLMIDFVPS